MLAILTTATCPDPRDDLPGPCPIGGVELMCYRTVAAVQGAAHLIIMNPSIILGARIDRDPGWPAETVTPAVTMTTSADSAERHDEDGLMSFTVTQDGRFEVTVLVRADLGGGGSLSVFVDLNDDGVLADGTFPGGGTREKVIVASVMDGINTVRSLPGVIQPGDHLDFIRLRIAPEPIPPGMGLHRWR